MRTAHQLDPKAQLLLAISPRAEASSDDSGTGSSSSQNDRHDAGNQNGHKALAEGLGRAELADGHASNGKRTELHKQQGWASASIDRWMFGDSSGGAAADVFPAPRFQVEQGASVGQAGWPGAL